MKSNSEPKILDSKVNRIAKRVLAQFVTVFLNFLTLGLISLSNSLRCGYDQIFTYKDLRSNNKSKVSASSTAERNQELTDKTDRKPPNHPMPKKLEGVTRTRVKNLYRQNQQPFPDYIIDEKHFDDLDRLVKRISSPSIEQITGSVVQELSRDLGTNWYFFSKKEMEKNKFGKIYNEIKGRVESLDAQSRIGIIIDKSGIFFPHAFSTVACLLQLENYQKYEGLFEPCFVNDDEGNKVIFDRFFRLFKECFPEEAEKYGYQVTSWEEGLQEQEAYAKVSEEKLSNISLMNPYGLCIGEDHRETAPKKYLIDRMDWLVDQGFTHLYLEHIPQSIQPLVDAYINGNEDSPKPALLFKSLYGLNSTFHLNFRYSYSEIIESAKRANLKVVVFETQATYNTLRRCGQIYEHIDERISMMNYKLIERMKEIPPTGKYLALVGGAHLTKNNGTPGLKETLGCLTVHISDMK